MVSMLLFSSYNGITTVYAASGYEYVLLTKYTKIMKIGDEYYLTAITSTGKKPKFSSSDSAVASVNTYGKITAKKAGNATITAKIANGEASCRVTVEKTVITLSQKSISLENGYTARLKAETSTGHPVTYKSARSSIASVDENGVITAKKPGETTITVTADKTAQTCKVTVKQPTADIQGALSSIFILYDPAGFQSTTGTLRYLDGSLPQSDADNDWWNMVYHWDDCPVLAGLDLGDYTSDAVQNDSGSSQELLSHYYIGVRGAWTKDAADLLSGGEALWQALTAGAVSTVTKEG